MNTGQSFDPEEQQRVKNKKRLLIQNRKLNTQIKKLEQEMNEILGIRNQEDSKQVLDLSKQRSEITVQGNYIRKLKNRIDFLKSANVKENSFFVRKEEDSLLILKKEYNNLMSEKQTRSKFIKDKVETLEKNVPFEKYKQSVEESLAQTKAQNRKMNSEIVQLEREQRKFHNYMQLKKLVERDKAAVDNIQFQVSKAESQVKQANRKINEIQNKWKPQFQALDKEYFQLKNEYIMTKDRLYESEKDFRQSETRVSALREEGQVKQFRERLSKVHTMDPQKFKKPEKVKKKRESSLVKSQSKEGQNELSPQKKVKFPKPLFPKKKSETKLSESSKIDEDLNAEEKVRQAKRKAILQQKNKKKLQKERMKKQQQIKEEEEAEKKRKRQSKKSEKKLVRHEWNQPPKYETKKLQTGDNSKVNSVSNEPAEHVSPKKQGKMLLKNKGVGPQ